MVVTSIHIDYEKCTSCKECVRACRYGVLGWLDGKPIAANASECHACRECEKSCRFEAITIFER